MRGTWRKGFDTEDSERRVMEGSDNRAYLDKFHKGNVGHVGRAGLLCLLGRNLYWIHFPVMSSFTGL